MSLFDCEFINIASGKYEAVGDSEQLLFCDVIKPDYDFTSDFSEYLDERERSTNLEEMMNNTAYLRQGDYQQERTDRLTTSECNNSLEEEENDFLPRLVLNNEYMVASPYGVSSPNARSTTSSTASGGGGSSKRKSSSKVVDKDSDEYKRRRTLNNEAVKKSRLKAKRQAQDTAERFKILSADNNRLVRRIEQLTQEIQSFRDLFANFPDHLKAEVAKACPQFNIHTLQHHAR